MVVCSCCEKHCGDIIESAAQGHISAEELMAAAEAALQPEPADVGSGRDQKLVRAAPNNWV